MAHSVCWTLLLTQHAYDQTQPQGGSDMLIFFTLVWRKLKVIIIIIC